MNDTNTQALQVPCVTCKARRNEECKGTKTHQRRLRLAEKAIAARIVR